MYLLSEYMWLFIIILASNSIKINNNSEPETIYVQPEQLVYLEPEAEDQIGFKVFSETCGDNFAWFAITIVSSIPKQ